MQAKIKHQEKAAKYGSESLKYWNRETSFVRGKQRIGMGLSRTKSDAYQKALYALGKARKTNERLTAKYNKKAGAVAFKDAAGTGYSTRHGVQAYKDLLAQKASIESSIDNTFGRNMALLQQGIGRDYRNRMARNREALGVRPEYGAPVFMPPKDRAGQFMNNLSLGLQIASLGMGG